MTLRILGGEFKGRNLDSPRGTQTRPTTSMLRKAVFDILQTTIEDATFLDLFAGSGAMGFEAISRGASHATFVESHKEALRSIHHNITTLKLEARTTVYTFDVFEVLKKLAKKNETFDFIYADPPYNRPTIYLELLSFLDTTPLLSPTGIFFLESPLQFKNPPLQNLQPIDERRFSTSLLHQYRLKS
jgi:16S rRNA (guanine(966)-N(2))-methyltransferase RsmD